MIVKDGDSRWAISILSGEYDGHALEGVEEFCARCPTIARLIIGDEGYRKVAAQSGITFQRWQDYLLEGLPGAG